MRSTLGRVSTQAHTRTHTHTHRHRRRNREKQREREREREQHSNFCNFMHSGKCAPPCPPSPALCVQYPLKPAPVSCVVTARPVTLLGSRASATATGGLRNWSSRPVHAVKVLLVSQATLVKGRDGMREPRGVREWTAAPIANHPHSQKHTPLGQGKGSTMGTACKPREAVATWAVLSVVLEPQDGSGVPNAYHEHRPQARASACARRAQYGSWRTSVTRYTNKAL